MSSTLPTAELKNGFPQCFWWDQCRQNNREGKLQQTELPIINISIEGKSISILFRKTATSQGSSITVK